LTITSSKIPLYSNTFRYIFSSASDFGMAGKCQSKTRKMLYVCDDEENDYRNVIS